MMTSLFVAVLMLLSVGRAERMDTCPDSHSIVSYWYDQDVSPTMQTPQIAKTPQTVKTPQDDDSHEDASQVMWHLSGLATLLIPEVDEDGAAYLFRVIGTVTISVLAAIAYTVLPETVFSVIVVILAILGVIAFIASDNKMRALCDGYATYYMAYEYSRHFNNLVGQ